MNFGFRWHFSILIQLCIFWDSMFVWKEIISKFRWHCISIWSLVKLQKRAAQIILKADLSTPSEQRFKKLNWLTFPIRVQYHSCHMVYRGINGYAPEYISSMLTYVSEKHEKHTGQQLSIYCIFQDLTHLSLTGHFQFKVRNYGIPVVYPLTLETALLSMDLKAH